MAFTGEVLAHRAVNRGAMQADGTYNYMPMFANVASLISSFDLAICHLESPVGPHGEVIVEPERLAVAATIGAALASAGYDRCSTASNHSLSGGVFGVQATIDALAAAGVGQSGMASSAAEVLPPILVINGVRVAHLAYSYGFDGDRTPAGEEWRANLIDPARIVSDAQAERSPVPKWWCSACTGDRREPRRQLPTSAASRRPSRQVERSTSSLGIMRICCSRSNRSTECGWYGASATICPIIRPATSGRPPLKTGPS